MIKKANKQNIENISKLIYDAIHEVANSLTGENEEHKILKTLENYIQMDVCRLSYNNIYTYEIDNKNVAILLAYNSNDIETKHINKKQLKEIESVKNLKK